jgi:3-methyladenine DNA glycosylase AlkC
MPDCLHRCKEVIEQILHPQDISDFSGSETDTHLEEEGLRGWMIMPVADFVSRRWIAKDFLQGLGLLKQLTRRFSAEFAIRDFILADAETAMQEITEWTQDPNEHVRRLASEGTRPRLPWGQQLPRFMAEPEALAPILEALMDDDAEYVRRSVANNLNDIAKDNPDFVIDFVDKHLLGASNNRKKLFKHACRSLFKQGDARTLALFGYQPFEGQIQIQQLSKSVEWDGKLDLEIEVQSKSEESQNLMLDYVIWHQKANGSLTPKVFKWKLLEGFSGSIRLKKSHSFKPVTTRKYYPGDHKIEIQINGKVFSTGDFLLLK